MKKEGEGKIEERKIKRTIIALEGSATYCCKFNKEWSKKNRCIQQVKKDPRAFFVQFV